MPTIQEIRTALGKMDESPEKPSRELLSINEKVNPFSEKLFSPIEQLQSEIRDKDKIIESLKNESIILKNQISIIEEEKYTALEGLKKSRWLESKVVLATKKVYEDKVKTIINENVDSKMIPILTSVGRRKQGNQQLNWGNWLKIPENRYLYEVNKDIAKGIFEDTNALISRIQEAQGGGKELTKFNNYSLLFAGPDNNNSDGPFVSTAFDPQAYSLNEGFTVSYWVKWINHPWSLQENH